MISCINTPLIYYDTYFNQFIYGCKYLNTFYLNNIVFIYLNQFMLINILSESN